MNRFEGLAIVILKVYNPIQPSMYYGRNWPERSASVTRPTTNFRGFLSSIITNHTDGPSANWSVHITSHNTLDKGDKGKGERHRGRHGVEQTVLGVNCLNEGRVLIHSSCRRRLVSGDPGGKGGRSLTKGLRLLEGPPSDSILEI